MVTAACVGSMTGIPSTSHDDDIRAVRVAERASYVEHFLQRVLTRRGLGHTHFQWALAGQAIQQAHLAHVAHVPADRSLLDRNHPKTVSAGQRRQHTAFIYTENRTARRFAADVEAGVGIARDDIGVVVLFTLYQTAERQRYALHMLLCFNAERSLQQRPTNDFRAVLEPQRRKRIVKAARDDLIGVGVDNKD
jgi:hypothetical protein